jgi:Pyruvate/2-oxoacid:ferredoxin oxidoreductase delta subunit
MQPKKSIKCLADMPVMPLTIGTMEWNQTGTWRYLTPTASNKIPPCRSNCPAGMPIPDFINALKAKGDAQALSVVMRQNPLPGLTGRLCYHPCQPKCIRREHDSPIQIQRLERYVSNCDLIESHAIAEKGTGNIAVIGAGPIGLACAYFLGVNGFEVTVMDAGQEAGGALLKVSVEKLDPKVRADEIDRMVAIAGLNLNLGQTDLAASLTIIENSYDIVVVDPTSVGHVQQKPLNPDNFDPLSSTSIVTKKIVVTLPEKLIPFKPGMIAHYIGIGHLTANHISALMKKDPALSCGIIDLSEHVAKDCVRLVDGGPAASAPLKVSREKEWSEEQAMVEAERCLSCGTCNECGQCVQYCPEVSIQIHDGLEFDLFHCKGCGICAYECPRGVIMMEEAKA